MKEFYTKVWISAKNRAQQALLNLINGLPNLEVKLQEEITDKARRHIARLEKGIFEYEETVRQLKQLGNSE
jgi:hypothetical protein